jgi:hypothetical protein
MSIEISNNISNQKISNQVKKFEIFLAEFIFFKLFLYLEEFKRKRGETTFSSQKFHEIFKHRSWKSFSNF